MASYYEYYKNYCVCEGEGLFIGMRDLEGVETGSYPVFVYNVDSDLIGEAATKEEYITVWNSDPANQVVGTLISGPGPFSFLIDLKEGQSLPPWVIGEPDDSGVDLGIYAIQYADEYE